MSRLAVELDRGSAMDIAVLGCSKGAEVYSIAWTLKTARPDLAIKLHAIDLSQEIVEFAKQGVYSLQDLDFGTIGDGNKRVANAMKVNWNTHRDQQGSSPIYRMSEAEMNEIFDHDGDFIRVKSWIKEGISWNCADAGDPALPLTLGKQDMVIANRFLCHMEPIAAERVLRNLGRLVKRGGYLFVSGVDLDVRTRVALDMKWTPVTELMEAIHDGDPSIRDSWPFEYWAKEPYQARRRDAMIRYASAFQIS